jgi:hypothetical protein
MAENAAKERAAFERGYVAGRAEPMMLDADGKRSVFDDVDL